MLHIAYGCLFFASLVLVVMLIVDLLHIPDRGPKVRPGRPDYALIRKLEIDNAIGPCPEGYSEKIVMEDGRPVVYWIKDESPSGRVLKEAWIGKPGSWRGKPGEVIEYDGPPMQWTAAGNGHSVGVVTGAMLTDEQVEASRRHRRYDDEAQQLFESMVRIAGR